MNEICVLMSILCILNIFEFLQVDKDTDFYFQLVDWSDYNH